MIQFRDHSWTVHSRWRQFPRGLRRSLETPEEVVSALTLFSAQALADGVIERCIFCDDEVWATVTPEGSSKTPEEAILLLYGSMEAWKERQRVRFAGIMAVFFATVEELVYYTLEARRTGKVNRWGFGICTVCQEYQFITEWNRMRCAKDLCQRSLL